MRLSPVIAAAALCACTAAPPPPAGPVQLTDLAGRTAGAPQPCVPITQTESSLRISEGDRHTLLYGSGPTIWVNRLGPGCGFAQTDTLVSEVQGSHYCRGDIVRAIDVLSRIPGPSCVLGDFVPYRR